jgi:hypothetical protein
MDRGAREGLKLSELLWETVVILQAQWTEEPVRG